MHCVLAACGALVHIVSSLCTARPHRVITACGHDVTACIRGAHTQHSHSPLMLSGLGADATCFDQEPETLGPQRFREQVRQLIFRPNVVHRNDVSRHVLADKVVPDVDVLSPRIVSSVVCQCNCTLVV
ncbi:hypothetical protein PR001_g22796, partial [Phytophthora rubi]